MDILVDWCNSNHKDRAAVPESSRVSRQRSDDSLRRSAPLTPLLGWSPGERGAIDFLPSSVPSSRLAHRRLSGNGGSQGLRDEERSNDCSMVIERAFIAVRLCVCIDGSKVLSLSVFFDVFSSVFAYLVGYEADWLCYLLLAICSNWQCRYGLRMVY